MKIALVSSLLFFALQAGAETYAVGDRIEVFALDDQHGTNHVVDNSVSMIVFSRDMDGGDLIKQALSNAPPDLLKEKRAVYIADISSMPGLIAKFFAIPSMRKRPYPMLLDRDGVVTARLPDVEGKATLIIFEDLRIERVLHLETVEEVRLELGIADPG